MPWDVPQLSTEQTQTQLMRRIKRLEQLVVDKDDENKKLVRKIERLKTQNDELNDENANLKRSNTMLKKRRN